MKRSLTIIAFLLTLTASYSFAASGDSINGEIRTSFKKDFQNAHIMSTEAHKGFTKLTFKMNEMIMFAFYSEDGQLLAVTRNIVSSQLPVSLQMSLRNDYKGYWITDLFELTGDNDNSYYISLENADSKIVLRSFGDNWEIYSSVKKDSL